MPRELQLLLACARVATSPEQDASIRGLLVDGVDWTALTQKAFDHGLVALVGQHLIRVASDLIPEDILDAYRAFSERTRRQNLALFEAFACIAEALALQRVNIIPIKGPTLALDAYGD